MLACPPEVRVPEPMVTASTGATIRLACLVTENPTARMRQGWNLDDVFADFFAVHVLILLKYSLAQKHCTKFSNEKSLVFLTVDLYEILHASTCTIYAYIHKVKNLPQMATLTYSHFGNPGRSYHRAH